MTPQQFIARGKPVEADSGDARYTFERFGGGDGAPGLSNGELLALILEPAGA
jgi:hypothetical protein